MLKVLNCLVCDDVRQEISGKFILIGVYGSDLHVLQPTPEKAGMMLNLWAELETGLGATPKVKLRAIIESDSAQREELTSEDTAFELDLNFAHGPEVTQTLAVQFQCRIDFTHTLRFELKADDGEWQFARRLKVHAAVPHSELPAEDELAVN